MTYINSSSIEQSFQPPNNSNLLVRIEGKDILLLTDFKVQ